MKSQSQNDFDQNTLEAMMERYRAELLRYQRATPPGKPTLEDNLFMSSAPSSDADNITDENFSETDPTDLIPAGELSENLYENETDTPSSLPQQPPDEMQTDIPQDPIWEQPAVFVMQNPSDPVPDPPPTLQTEPPLLPKVCSCHTEFEKCIGGYGYFSPYEHLGGITCAPFLQDPGKKTRVMVRFAADIPFGAAETARCRRSFSVKFFCDEGEYDMPGSHLPVWVGCDTETLSKCCLAMRRDPVSGLYSKENFWEFVSNHHQSLNAVLWLYSDLGTIGSYRMIDGFSPPCFWVNKKGEKHLVKTRWLSRQRPQMLSRSDAQRIAALDPDHVSRDFVKALQNGEKVQYELAVQMIPAHMLSAALSFDPFDPTVCWPEDEFSLQRLGLLTIDSLPHHFEQEICKAEFDFSSPFPGIEYPPLRCGDGLKAAAAHIRSLGELNRKIIVCNMAEELKTLPPELLEEILILFTDTDTNFGRALTLAIGRI